MSWLGQIFHNGCERTTTVGRAAMGLAIGTLVGTGLVTVVSVFTMGPLAIFAAIVSFFVWAFGLLVIATPGWVLLNWLGARCQPAAVMYGFGLTFATVLAYDWNQAPTSLEPDRLTATLLGAGLVAAGGGIVGWVVAKVAYSPPVLEA